MTILSVKDFSLLEWIVVRELVFIHKLVDRTTINRVAPAIGYRSKVTSMFQLQAQITRDVLPVEAHVGREVLAHPRILLGTVPFKIDARIVRFVILAAIARLSCLA